MATPVFTVRLKDDIRGDVQRRAADLGITESEFVRRSLVQTMESQPLAQLTGGSRAEMEVPREREGVAA